MIYEHVLTFPGGFELRRPTSNSRHEAQCVLGRRDRKPLLDALALSAVCKQIGAETALVLPTFNTLGVTLRDPFCVGNLTDTMSPLTETCREIRGETRALFLAGNKLTVPVSDPLHYRPSCEKPKFGIPPGLVSLGREIHIRVDLNMTISEQYLGHRLGNVRDNVRDLAKPVIKHFRPPKVIIELDIQFHRFGFDFGHSRLACSKDVPLSEYQAGRLMLSFEYVGGALDNNLLDAALEAKRQQLSAHADPAVHRMCSIRAERANLPRQLEEERRVVERVLELMPGDLFE